MRIGSRIAIGFIVVLVLTAFVGAIGWKSLGDYAQSVEQTQRMKQLTDALGRSGESIARFRADGDRQLIDDTARELDGAASLAEELSLTTVLEAIGRFRAGVDSFATLDADNVKRRADMMARAARIEELAIELYAAQELEYAMLSGDMAEAEDALKKRLETATLAESLIRNTLAAREAEARFSLTRSAKQSKKANKAIRDMYMTAIKLKKLTKGTKDEGSVSKVAPAVGTYRKSFAMLSKAIKSGADTEGLSKKLGRASMKINAFTGAIAKRQRSAYDTVRASTVEMRQAVDRSVIAQSEALRLIGVVRALRLGERAFLDADGANDTRKGVDDALKQIGENAGRLQTALADEDSAKSVNEISEAAKAYGEDFAAMAKAVTDQITAEHAMNDAQTEAVGLVNGAAATQILASDEGRIFADRLIIGGSIGALVIGLGFAVFIGRGITVPLGRIAGTMERLAADDLSVDVQGLTRKDEIGAMAKTVQVFKDNGLEMRRLSEEQKRAEKRAVEERRSARMELADGFEANVMGIVETVGASARTMKISAGSLTSIAEKVSEQSAAVSAATEQTSANVATVASATEELSSSIDEIGKQVERASRISGGAVTKAEETNVTIKGLAEAAQRIGEVVNLITDVAEQTNLLALNATIEAARAGDAGKGFAVVASEVKNLATQTARATDEISTQIADIQGVTKKAVVAIGEITTVIGDINEIAGGIAAAVEEQSAATQEIARNVQEASAGAQEVAENVIRVRENATEAGTAAEEVLSASTSLSTDSDTLRTDVDGFINQIRTS